MSKDNLIDLMYLFKDGESTPEERSHLFENLAYSKELQDEFHELVCFENSVAHNASISSPANATKANILKKAGIATTSVSMTYLKNIILYSLLFISGILVKGIISSDEADSLQYQKQSQKTIPYSIATENSEYINRKSSKPTSNTVIDNNKLSYKTNESDKASIKPQPHNEVKNIAQDTEYKAKYSIEEMPSTHTNYSLNYVPESFEQPQSIEAISESTYSISKFEFTFSNIVGLFLLPKRKQTTTYDNGFNNFSVGLSYKLNQNNYLGLELSRETFDLFIQTQDDLLLNKSLYLYGAKYRYDMKDLELMSDLHPFSEIVIGGASVGPYAKARLGILWQPESIIKVYGTIEGTALGYRYKDRYESTSKISINYGVMLNF